MESRLLVKPELCYQHIGKLLKADFYKIATNSYYMVIIEQEPELLGCNFPSLGILSSTYPNYLKSSDKLFIRGNNKDRDFNPVALDFESFNKTKDKLIKLEKLGLNEIELDINCNLIQNNENIVMTFNNLIENKKDLENLRIFFNKVLSTVENIIKE